MIKKSVLAALIAMSVPAAAIAETVTGNVPANRATKVYAFTVADSSTCASPGRPKMKVAKAPKHGTVTFDWGFVPAGKAFRNCQGGRMRAMAIIYTPAKGYRGEDSFTVGYSFPDLGGYISVGHKSRKFVLQVK
jgi:hypothetical protein